MLSLLSGVAQKLEKGRNKVGEPTVVEGEEEEGEDEEGEEEEEVFCEQRPKKSPRRGLA